jgi:hypothetical protein
MRRSLCLSITSLILGAGCGDDACGPSGAPEAGLVGTATGVTLTYGGMKAGQNNDCPDPAAPADVVSLTVNGAQTDGTGFVTICISRPDRLADGSQTLGPDVAGSEVRLVDLSGMSAGCGYTLGNAVTGTVTASGLCGGGADPAGFALDVTATVTLNRVCMGDTVEVSLAGRTAVLPM